MKQDLINADFDDKRGDLKYSAQNAWDINVKYSELVTNRILNQERNKIVERRELGDSRNRTSTEGLPPIAGPNEHVQFKEEVDNLEYASMIASINAKLDEFNAEIRRIEEDNGIFNQTRDTW